MSLLLSSLASFSCRLASSRAFWVALGLAWVVAWEVEAWGAVAVEGADLWRLGAGADVAERFCPRWGRS